MSPIRNPSVRRLSAALITLGVPAMTCLASRADAQTPPVTSMAALRQACMADVRSVCAGIQPGGGRIMQCMQQNADRLSAGCRQAIDTARAAHPPATTAPGTPARP